MSERIYPRLGMRFQVTAADGRQYEANTYEQVRTVIGHLLDGRRGTYQGDGLWWADEQLVATVADGGVEIWHQRTFPQEALRQALQEGRRVG